MRKLRSVIEGTSAVATTAALLGIVVLIVLAGVSVRSHIVSAADRVPMLDDSTKAQLAVMERDMTNIRSQMVPLNDQFQKLALQANALIAAANAKAGKGWQLNPDTFTFNKVAPPQPPAPVKRP